MKRAGPSWVAAREASVASGVRRSTAEEAVVARRLVDTWSVSEARPPPEKTTGAVEATGAQPPSVRRRVVSMERHSPSTRARIGAAWLTSRKLRFGNA